nr:MAG TPA: Site-specific DNA methylase [Ackermannviridae sp.]DAW82222.1 MAG TPA: Site-specific DNA methylase [Bacteriophage sp.]
MVTIVYQGSKNRLAKYIIPILNKLIKENNCEIFIDACCGGANIIANTKYPIICNKKYGFDNNKYLIALFDKIKFDNLEYIHIDENEYKKVKQDFLLGNNTYEDWYYGYVGFLFSYGGLFWGVYARGTDAKGNPRNMGRERYNNLINQKEALKDTIFTIQNIFDINLDKLNKNMLIYIDPPYKDTKQYNKQKFDTEKFWNLVREMSKRCIVVVSEYEAPNDFITIWEKEIVQNINKRLDTNTQLEKLFVIKDYWWKYD